MFDVSNWVASLNGENGPGGTSHEALSVSPQGALEISSITEQPPSLDRSHLCTPRLVAEPCKRDGRLRPSSQRPQYPTLYRRLKRRLGRSLRTGAPPLLMVTGLPLLTPWAHRANILLIMRTFMLLSSFHRDRPKSSRNLPKWNLSVVLNELTKAPFEPMKDTDHKHLTLKTTFLLALASGKRRSEIHAWVANKVSNLGQWEKVALFSKCVSGDYSCFDYHCR